MELLETQYKQQNKYLMSCEIFKDTSNNTCHTPKEVKVEYNEEIKQNTKEVT